jgi:hypothetical protein
MSEIVGNLAKIDRKIGFDSKKIPSDFESEDAFLQDMREKYDYGVGHDEHNVSAGRDDAKFVVGKQWDDYVEARRRRQNKPTLTFNRLIAFVAQIIGQRLMNETEIRVWPDHGGTKEIALIREGIIRAIYKNSGADFARDEAHKYQVIGGRGVFALTIDYAQHSVFNQEIKLKAVRDPYSAVFDPMGIEPSGRDCKWGFLTDEMPVADAKAAWPKAKNITSFEGSAYTGDFSGSWYDQETVRIVAYWRMVTEGEKLLALMQDGTVQDVTDKETFEYINDVQVKEDGTAYIREMPNRFAQLYVCSGNEILDGPYNYPISSIPIYRVPGWEIDDGEKTYRWGLVRFLKDPQRLHNYWRSVLAEQLIAAPRNKWLVTVDAIKGHEAKWRMAPTSDDPFLYYNDGETAPNHIPPSGIDAALITEAGSASQDMKDISNIHEASLGMPSNEVSKVAIQQRQQVSDVGSYIFTDRLKMADERCAENINELTSYIYDATRTVVTIGRDGKMKLQEINTNQLTDVTIGQYGVTVKVGPATATKRQQSAEQMMAFVNAIPESAKLVMDLVAEAQDWEKAEEFAKRFRLGLPPGMIPEDELTDQEKQAQAATQQVEQLQMQLAQAEQEAKINKMHKDAILAEARAAQAEASAYKARLDADSRMADTESKIEDRDHQQVLDTVEQHNRLVAEDRAFDAAEDERKKPTPKKPGEPKNAK